MSKLLDVETNFGTTVKISEYNVELVERVIKYAPLCKHIKEVIVFGSALEERCNENSDLDICVVTDYKYGISRFQKLKSYDDFTIKVQDGSNNEFIHNIDILYTSNLEKDILRYKGVFVDIALLGKCVYKRDNCSSFQENCKLDLKLLRGLNSTHYIVYAKGSLDAGKVLYNLYKKQSSVCSIERNIIGYQIKRCIEDSLKYCVESYSNERVSKNANIKDLIQNIRDYKIPLKLPKNIIKYQSRLSILVEPEHSSGIKGMKMDLLCNLLGSSENVYAQCKKLGDYYSKTRRITKIIERL